MKPDTCYTFTVAIRNDQGLGQPGAELDVYCTLPPQECVNDDCTTCSGDGCSSGGTSVHFMPSSYSVYIIIESLPHSLSFSPSYLSPSPSSLFSSLLTSSLSPSLPSSSLPLVPGTTSPRATGLSREIIAVLVVCALIGVALLILVVFLLWKISSTLKRQKSYKFSDVPPPVDSLRRCTLF